MAYSSIELEQMVGFLGTVEKPKKKNVPKKEPAPKLETTIQKKPDVYQERLDYDDYMMSGVFSVASLFIGAVGYNLMLSPLMETISKGDLESAVPMAFGTLLTATGTAVAGYIPVKNHVIRPIKNYFRRRDA